MRPAAGFAPVTRFCTTVNRHVDATGKVTDVRLTGRKVTVSGIRGVRAVAFETIFDRASNANAMQAVPFTKSQPPPARYEMVWDLQPYQPVPPKGEK